MPDLQLTGCSPAPLASYLKGLAVLRLVGEQADPDARGFWENEFFVLRSKLDREKLLTFFLDQFVPTPVIAPWNGGSGFNPKDNQDGIVPILKSQASRLRPYRQAIETAMRIRSELGIQDKAEGELKLTLQKACRAGLPDEALAWFDAAIVLTSERPSYPALLGTGGNDGRLDFSNNFMQRVIQLLDPTTGSPAEGSASWLQGSLFGGVFYGMKSLAIGQFDPGNAGGANGTSGFEAGALVNAWDFLLMLEGALLFAAASSRRLGDSLSVLACPFSVNAVGVGYPSAAGGDESKTRNEMWMPLWNSPASLAELRTLMAEGRAQVGQRRAQNAVDFARAVSTLGVDRGLTAFQRYAFHERNGQSFLALPLDRFAVGQAPKVELLEDLDRDGWLDTLRRRASADTAPASVKRALRGLDISILALCKDSTSMRLQDVLIAIGAIERSLARSLKWTRESFLSPCRPLNPEWLVQANDDSPTWRLAVSLAGMRGHHPLRCHLEPVTPTGARWEENSPEVVWHDGDPIEVMNAILRRRLLKAEFDGPGARLVDVAAFLDGTVDAGRLLELVWGLVLVRGDLTIHKMDKQAVVPALYGLLALALQSREQVPVEPAIHQVASRGDGSRAGAMAIRRLRASGLPVALREVHEKPGERSRRCAAAVLFPLTEAALRALAFQLLIAPKIDIDKEAAVR